MTIGLVVAGIALVAGALRGVYRGQRERAELSAWAELLWGENDAVGLDRDYDLPVLDAPLHRINPGPFIYFSGGGPLVDEIDRPGMNYVSRTAPKHLRTVIDEFRVAGVERLTIAPSSSTTWSEVVETWDAVTRVRRWPVGLAFGVRSHVVAPPPSRMDPEIRHVLSTWGIGALHGTMMAELVKSRCPNPWLLPDHDMRDDNYVLFLWVRECAPWTDFASIRALHWAMEGRWDNPGLVTSSASVLPAADGATGAIAMSYPAAAKWPDIAADVIARVNAASGPVRLVVSGP